MNSQILLLLGISCGLSAWLVLNQFAKPAGDATWGDARREAAETRWPLLLRPRSGTGTLFLALLGQLDHWLSARLGALLASAARETVRKRQ